MWIMQTLKVSSCLVSSSKSRTPLFRWPPRPVSWCSSTSACTLDTVTTTTVRITRRDSYCVVHKKQCPHIDRLTRGNEQWRLSYVYVWGRETFFTNTPGWSSVSHLHRPYVSDDINMFPRGIAARITLEEVVTNFTLSSWVDCKTIV